MKIVSILLAMCLVLIPVSIALSYNEVEAKIPSKVITGGKLAVMALVDQIVAITGSILTVPMVIILYMVTYMLTMCIGMSLIVIFLLWEFCGFIVLLIPFVHILGLFMMLIGSPILIPIIISMLITPITMVLAILSPFIAYILLTSIGAFALLYLWLWRQK